MRLRELRKTRHMSMKELGQLLGCSESTVSLYETGKREPGIEMLLHMAEIFHVSADYLLGAAEHPDGDLGRAIAGALPDLEAQQAENLLTVYRALSPARKKQLAEYATYLYLVETQKIPDAGQTP